MEPATTLREEIPLPCAGKVGPVQAGAVQAGAVQPVSGEISLPGSKSLTHRALVAASLAAGHSEILDPLMCEDTQYTLEALKTMGAKIVSRESRLLIEGLDGKPFPGKEKLFLGYSGTSLRFLLSIAALSSGTTRLYGESRLLERPVSPLFQALTTMGARVKWGEKQGFIEVKGGPIHGGEVTIPGDISSQFISSLLMIAPLTEKGINIHLSSPLISRPYVEMTIDVMKSFGVEVTSGPGLFSVAGNQKFHPCKYPIEGDLSAAGYFWAAAAATHGRIVTTRVSPHTKQGDRHLLDIFEKMGCIIEKKHTAVMVEGRPLQGIEANMADVPDQVPTLAAVALLARGETIISGASHLRHKESDRLQCLETELRKLGADVQVLSDGLRIRGQVPLTPAVLDPHNDHRLAMSFAVLGLAVPGLRLRNPDCVRKSFPDFWNSWEKIIPVHP